MTAVALAAPFAMNDATLKIDADSFEAAVTSVKFTPAPAIATIPTINGDSTPVAGASQWTLAVGYAQDHKTPSSLARYLHDNEGLSKTVTFEPQGAVTGDPTFTATVTIVAGEIGGDANSPARSSVNMPSSRPVRGSVV